MWSNLQLNEQHASIGAGVRSDVSPIPLWMKKKIEKPMVDAGIVQKDFINSIAMNIYHDGEEGLGQHFDDAVRFKQPIYSLRIFSDSRLSFGSQLYIFCNGAFTIPISRGCILVMEEGSFAANGVKHCIRPMDMTGKSAAFILRQMHLPARSDSLLYSEKVDLPMHLSTLSLEDEAVPYFVQKRLESEENMNGTSKRGPKPKDNMKVQPPNFEANTLVDEKLTI